MLHLGIFSHSILLMSAVFGAAFGLAISRLQCDVNAYKVYFSRSSRVSFGNLLKIYSLATFFPRHSLERQCRPSCEHAQGVRFQEYHCFM